MFLLYSLFQTVQLRCKSLSPAIIIRLLLFIIITYLRLSPPIPREASSDKLCPPSTMAGSLSRITPVHTHHLKSSFSVSCHVLLGPQKWQYFYRLGVLPMTQPTA